ncbi:hypothetical protein SBRY_100186 [Actinacidiphila bryophytorum]|uniref:Uncharacterized protein n=1 Tax=Actinacidiphila bryophytorum TaxID=1436133 RepID=A0A9W4GXV7_9ACTN|nr:hypothetical protein SBRY_100186 [Actinacidiphila bryophytorum]
MKHSTVLWRFRRNRLRRRSYAVEGWVLLALGAAATVGAALTGLAGRTRQADCEAALPVGRPAPCDRHGISRGAREAGPIGPATGHRTALP